MDQPTRTMTDMLNDYFPPGSLEQLPLLVFIYQQNIILENPGIGYLESLKLACDRVEKEYKEKYHGKTT